MKRSFSAYSLGWSLSLLFTLLSCSRISNLTTAQNPCSLPIRRGAVSYGQDVAKREINIEELFMIVRAWMRDHADYYSLEQEIPAWKNMLPYSAAIPSDRIDPDIKYATKPRVTFNIAVDAENDTFRVFLCNYQVSGIRQSEVYLEKMLTDTTICKVVDRESREIVQSLSDYLRKRNQKVL